MAKKTKLKNGLTLITAKIPQTEAVTVLVLLPVGSRYEDKKINGASHFLEHLMFKGTKKRPNSLLLTKILDSVGAEYNAFTSKDHTGYYIKVAKENLNLAFDVLSDMLFNSLFDAKEIEKERGVIIEEINMYQDNPLIHIQSILEEVIFKGNNLANQIAGPKEVIKKVTRDQLMDYARRFYSPKNMVLVVSGNFKDDQVNKLTRQYFGQQIGSGKTKLKYERFVSRQRGVQFRIEKKATEQVQTCLGFLGYPIGDKRNYALILLSVILGGNMSSRLFSVVREQHGLAYYIKAEAGAYQDTGSLVIQAGLDRKRFDQAIKLILSELKKMKTDGVTKEELKAAQNFLKGKITLDLEDSESVADWYGKQQLFLNQLLTPQEKLKRLFAVKENEIKKIAQEIFTIKRLNVAIIGPEQGIKSALGKLSL